MLFFRAKVIPVNSQIHANVMRPLCVLIFFFLTIVYACIRYSSFLEISSRYSLVNKICSYCKCRTDRKYTETNNNVSLFWWFFYGFRNKTKWCVHIICIARFIWLMFILKKYRQQFFSSKIGLRFTTYDYLPPLLRVHLRLRLRLTTFSETVAMYMSS